MTLGLTGKAHFEDGSQSGSFALNAQHAVPVNIFDMTQEIVQPMDTARLHWIFSLRVFIKKYPQGRNRSPVVVRITSH